MHAHSNYLRFIQMNTVQSQPSHTFTHTGFALAALLHGDGTGDATMTICHEHTPPDQLPVMTRTADIIIVGTGDMSVCLSVCLSIFNDSL